MSKKLVLVSLAIVAAGGGGIAWWILSKPALPPGFAAGNGRLEAQEVDISTKYAGRIKEVLVDEGDTAEAGQVVATMDTTPLEAELRQANAKIREAQDNRNTALAEVKIKQAEFEYADKQYRRSKELVASGAVSEQERDIDLAHADVAREGLVASRAQVEQAQSAIDAAQGEADRLAADIKDNTLRAPIRVRVETRIAEPGEVLPAGGKVLTTTDLSDVYMYLFLPAEISGKLSLGSEARIVLDAIPDYPLYATVAFVSPSAQFTPKTVETAEERHNLSFRVKLQLDKERLRRAERMVKVGVPGMGYVRFDNNAAWPPQLQPNPNAHLPWNPTGSDSSGASSGNATGTPGTK